MSLPTWQDIGIPSARAPRELVDGSTSTSVAKSSNRIHVSVRGRPKEISLASLSRSWPLSRPLRPVDDSQEGSPNVTRKIKLISLPPRRRKETRSSVGHDDLRGGRALSSPGLASAAPDALLQFQEGSCGSSAFVSLVDSWSILLWMFGELKIASR